MQSSNCVSHSNGAAFDDSGEYTLAWHDAVPRLVKDGAFLMTLFADLGNFHNGCITQLKLGAECNPKPVDSLCGNIFREIAEVHIQSLLPGLGNAFRCEKAHLPMPLSCMRIFFQTMIF